MKSALEQCPLPPLPHPWSPLQIEESMYTADQMRDYARAAIAAADAALAAPKPDGRLHNDGYFTWTRRDGYVLDRRLPCDFYLAPVALPDAPKEPQ